MPALVWLTRDLRAHDHPALRAALDRHDRAVPVFCFDPRLLQGRHASGSRTQFILECLDELDECLGGIVFRHGPPEREANNNGNWRWIASVGVDPQPFFRRIYKPTLQMQRHDPEGRYVRGTCSSCATCTTSTSRNRGRCPTRSSASAAA